MPLAKAKSWRLCGYETHGHLCKLCSTRCRWCPSETTRVHAIHSSIGRARSRISTSYSRQCFIIEALGEYFHVFHPSLMPTCCLSRSVTQTPQILREIDIANAEYPISLNNTLPHLLPPPKIALKAMCIQIILQEHNMRGINVVCCRAASSRSRHSQGRNPTCDRKLKGHSYEKINLNPRKQPVGPSRRVGARRW